MGILIDSSALIAIERKGTKVSSYVKGREEEEMFISVISASELSHGVYRAKDPATKVKRQAFVEAVLSAFPILEIDLAIARSHAQLWSAMEAAGIMIGLHDSWLAATCLVHELSIVTGNVREFSRVPGLRVEAFAFT